MPEQQPDQFLAGVTARTDDSDFGFIVHDVKSNEPRIVQPEARACKVIC